MWCHLHIWGYWHFSQQSWSQLVKSWFHLEEAEQKGKQCPIVDVTGDVRRVWCCKQQYCIGTRNVKSMCLVAQSCLTLCDPMDYSLTCSSVQRDSPGKNTGVGCHALFQGIFPTQGSNPGILHCRWILYCLSHQGSPLKIKLSWKWTNRKWWEWTSLF